MDLEIIILREINQTKTNTICHLHVQHKENDTNEFIYKTEVEPQT